MSRSVAGFEKAVNAWDFFFTGNRIFPYSGPFELSTRRCY